MEKHSIQLLKRISVLILAVLEIVLNCQGAQSETSQRNIFSYSFKYLGLTVAHGSITISDSLLEEGRPVKQINARASSVSPTSFLFRFDNQYITRVDATTGYPMNYEKRIEQNNFQEQAVINFDQEQRQISYSKDRTISPSGPTHNLFSTLYFLLNHTFQPNEVIDLSVFAAGRLWQVKAQAVKAEKMSTPSGTYPTVMIEIAFHSSTSARDQSMDTDVLTNRLTREGKKMTLWISTKKERTLVKGEYELFPTHLQMILTNYCQKDN